MNKLLISGLFLSLLATNANAGFLSSMAGSAIGNAVTNNNTSYSEERMKKVNEYLRDMHFDNKYEKGYEFYLEYLEHSENIFHLATVAYVYNDHGNKKKALEVYEKRILPWVVLEDDRTKTMYKKVYEEIKNGKTETPAGKK